MSKNNDEIMKKVDKFSPYLYENSFLEVKEATIYDSEAGVYEDIDNSKVENNTHKEAGNHSNGSGNNHHDGGKNNHNGGNKMTHGKKVSRVKTVAIIVLSVLLGATSISTVVLANTNATYMNMAESSFNKAYNQFVMDLNNLETNLSKLFITNSSQMQIKGLNELSSLAMSAENNLTSLPTKSQSVKDVSKFLNQLMDYSKNLSDKVVNGNEITKEEKQTLKKLYEINVKLKDSVNQFLMENHGEMKMFSQGMFLRSDMIDPMELTYDSVKEGDIKYPALIYDGPFSDNIEEAKEEIGQENISESEAIKQVEKFFEKVQNVSTIKEERGDKASTYSFQGELGDRSLYAQVAKSNGMIVLFDAYRQVAEVNLTEDKAIAIAKDFINNLGYENVEAVWKLQSNNVLMINFATKLNDTIVYSELIKVKIALDNGEILGIEGLNYAVNSEKEKDFKTVLTEDEARAKVSKELKIDSVQKAIVPINKNHIMTYEFAGTYDGLKFYVYIDAKTGAEVRFMRVVKHGEGQQIL